MTPEEIQERIKTFPYWYHNIELAPGVVTPGFGMFPLWDHIREWRKNIDYTGKSVLDLASFDGMFAFEAEQLGAKLVVATDCLYRTLENFLFCREVLKSCVMPYYNVSPYRLTERLDVFFGENYNGTQEKFDIVQHFGLLYHLRDPMLSLSQARSVMKTGGRLILETDCVLHSHESFMLFNGDGRIRNNYSVWWAPTVSCLKEMLRSTFFQTLTLSILRYETPIHPAGQLKDKPATSQWTIGRVVVIAEAQETTGNEKLDIEVRRTYRNPGLEL